VDIKKLGRILSGGYAFLHNAVDDHSRLAYTEILTDEKKATAAGFWARANAYFESHGITAKRVLTDNGSCYRSYSFKDALGPAIKHKRTRPYGPQTNGKVERYNRTMLDEYACARPYRSETERVAAFAGWLHPYNHHRGHTSLKGQSPASRVTNLAGQYT
jgi:transposase InsO family protein